MVVVVSLLLERAVITCRVSYGMLVWQGTTKFAVFISQSSYGHLGNSGTNQRETLHDGTYQFWPGLSPFLGAVPRAVPQIRNFGHKFWSFNGESQRYVSGRA